MSRTFWIFVTLCVIAGVIAAIAIPSLLRARVSTTPPEPQYSTSLYLEGGGEYVPPAAAFLEGGGEYTPAPDLTPAAVHNTEDYDPIDDNTFQDARLNPLSTFSIDVDTASYSNVRRFLEMGQRPPKDAVRTEELINYFQYDYPEPNSEHPFSLTAEVAPCPWKPAHRLVHIGLQGRRIPDDELPRRCCTALAESKCAYGGGRGMFDHEVSQAQPVQAREAEEVPRSQLGGIQRRAAPPRRFDGLV